MTAVGDTIHDPASGRPMLVLTIGLSTACTSEGKFFEFTVMTVEAPRPVNTKTNSFKKRAGEGE